MTESKDQIRCTEISKNLPLQYDHPNASSEPIKNTEIKLKK